MKFQNLAFAFMLVLLLSGLTSADINNTYVALTPASPTTANTLVCHYNFTSNDTYQNISVNWFKNGANQTALASTHLNYTNKTINTTSLILGALAVVGDKWSCGVQGNDTLTVSAFNYSSNVTLLSPKIVGNLTEQNNANLVGIMIMLWAVLLVISAFFGEATVGYYILVSLMFIATIYMGLVLTTT